MARVDYDYPEDEFDVLARERVPQGVHRSPRPAWRAWLPFLVVLIAAPLLAIGLVRLVSGGDDSPSVAEPTSSAETTTESTPEPEATPEPEPEPEPTPEPEPLDQAVAVQVLNGAGVSGLAGRTVEVLVAAGWTAVEPGNYTSAEPSSSTVFYASPELADEAAAIAQQLGIEPVTELADVSSIVVVLRPDFSE